MTRQQTIALMIPALLQRSGVTMRKTMECDIAEMMDMTLEEYRRDRETNYERAIILHATRWAEAILSEVERHVK